MSQAYYCPKLQRHRRPPLMVDTGLVFTTDRAVKARFAFGTNSGFVTVIPARRISKIVVKEQQCAGTHSVGYFFGGPFLANTLPHLGNGISGHGFQSLFASLPGEGLSASVVNVLWGLFNLPVGYLLVCRVGS